MDATESPRRSSQRSCIRVGSKSSRPVLGAYVDPYEPQLVHHRAQGDPLEPELLRLYQELVARASA